MKRGTRHTNEANRSLAPLQQRSIRLPTMAQAPSSLASVPFSRAATVGLELEYLQQAIASGKLSGGGDFTHRCQNWLRERLGAEAALLTHSCTAALEMAVILAGVGPGDEVIMPSFTFVSTANAVALRGATPVFVDVRRDTLNIDEQQIEQAITARTRAVIAVHYGSVPADMDPIVETARHHGLTVIEDAAQALLSTYRGRQAGTLGDLAAFSFHDTKNLVSGEGGALVINDASLVERAEIIWEKGTNRRNFARGLVDKYTWVDLGSSFLPSELVAAFLLAQLEQAEAVNQERIGVWERYFQAFTSLQERGLVTLPQVPADVQHNGHLFHLILNTAEARDALISHMREQGITAPFHYVPLHDSPAGRQLGRIAGDLSWTSDVSSRLIRLPIYNSIGASRERVIDAVFDFFDPRV